ncbi:MAG: SpoIIE family protein phosphatase [Candidatus Eremiobacteraeota bacterium]|nr:SpoIIE family protein phosphatase [Candidatus Eremiobacteraeota bacterium]MCW5868871.1 SpoIIE family protein phosphatase [Candidatus Eremiobacteraeota bacterium]
MTRTGLFWQTLLLTSLMFAVVLTITVGLSISSIYNNLFRECENKGRAIAQGISRTSDELLVNRDLATVQASLDESLALEGVAYLFLSNGQGETVCHTFVPQVPSQVLQLPVSPTDITATRVALGSEQRRLDISAPIMAGVGGYIHVGMDLEKVYAAALREAALQGVAIGLIFLLSLGLVSLAVRRITGPVTVLTDCAQALSRHDFATDFPKRDELAQLVPRSAGEIGTLAESFLQMENKIQQSVLHLRQTTAAKERIEGELQVARHIQMSIVPKKFPAFLALPQMDIYATLEPSREVGGDLYDFFQLDDEHIFAVVGDVSGKGVPAALFMAVTQTLIKATARQGLPLGELMSRLNDELCENNEASMFVTLFAAILNVNTGQVEFSNGGHNLPFLLSPNKGPEQLPRTRGMGLGAAEGIAFQTSSFTMQPGQALVMYTDGISEAHNPAAELFTEERMRKFFAGQSDLGPRALVENLLDAVRAFEAGGPQADDITALVLTYLGPGGPVSREVANSLAELDNLAAAVEGFAASFHLSPTVANALQLAIEELFTNAVSYGYPAGQAGRLKLSLDFKDDWIEVELQDDARPFNPLVEGPEVNADASLEERDIGGLGIHLTRRLFDELAYERRNERNVIRLRKRAT